MVTERYAERESAVKGKKKCGWLLGRQGPLSGFASCRQSSEAGSRVERAKGGSRVEFADTQDKEEWWIEVNDFWRLRLQFDLEIDIVVFGLELAVRSVEPPNAPDWA